MDKPIQIQHLDEETPCGSRKKLQAYRDLDALAGTWNPEEAKEFFRAASCFGEIDESLWR